MITRSNTKLKTRIGNRSENMSKAQLDPMHRYDHSPRSGSFVPSVERFHRVGNAQTGLPRSASERTKSQDDHDQSRKSTVISRVKEKAKRWRSSFLKKRHSQGDNSISTTPSWGVRLEDDDNGGGDDEENYQDEDPEYLGAPMYESELAPETYKERARQHPRAFPVISEKHVLPNSLRHVSESVETKDQTTASETEKHATHETHKTSNSDDDDDEYQETEEHPLRSDDGPPLSSRENKWDKGVSVKEYIMNKLEPGEDEKVLSKVISDAIVVPMRNHGDHVGVMQKMKVAVNSLLGREEPNQSTMRQSNISMSTSAQPVMEEDNHGRILETNKSGSQDTLFATAYSSQNIRYPNMKSVFREYF